jgi:demethylmenaquinone methyltransferase / 2-methoxy-6-polyprenyl-1,4-benzoquinol methylase
MALPDFADLGGQQKQRVVDAVFDKVSRRYDVGNDLLSLGLHRVWRNRLIALARFAPDHDVLDIACGTGDVTFAAARRARSVVGTDNNPHMLRLAEQKKPADLHNVTFVEADAAALPFPDAKFDRVTISYATRGLPALDRVMAECFRVLKPGGELWILDFARPPWAVIDVAWRGTLAGWGAVVGTLVHGDPRTYLYIPASMKHYAGQHALDGTLKAAGFAPTEVIETTLALMAFNRAVKPRQAVRTST